jgi:predicted glycoside hydrolase/deacetylase ChbG (UPF0249 family)
MKQLIVNADDLGYDPAVDRGLLRALREGVVTSATLMVNTPFSADAAREARDLAVGLHLNLARGRPVSGRFPPALLEEGAFAEHRAATLPPEVVEEEARAQLELAGQLLGRSPTHLDVHKHLHRYSSVLEGVARAAKAAALPVRAIDAGMRAVLRTHGVPTTEHFIGEAGAEPWWTLPRFLAAVDALEHGTTELMCHPGEVPSHVRSGYSTQREVELLTVLAPEARAALERAGVVLADFRALHQGAGSTL